MKAIKLKLNVLMVSLFLLYCSNTYADIHAGLVAHFPFSGHPYDVSSNAYLGSAFGATLTTDRFGTKNSAYAFSADQFIQTNVDDEYISNEMSLSFWMKTSTERYRYGGDSYLISTYGSEGGGTAFSYYKGTVTTTGLSFNLKLYDNIWHHIVVNYNANSISTYIDGLLYTSKSTDPFKFEGDFFKFGKFRPSVQAIYGGVLDDVRIYNRTLSRRDVLELFREENYTDRFGCPGDTKIVPKVVVIPLL